MKLLHKIEWEEEYKRNICGHIVNAKNNLRTLVCVCVCLLLLTTYRYRTIRMRLLNCRVNDATPPERVYRAPARFRAASHVIVIYFHVMAWLYNNVWWRLFSSNVCNVFYAKRWHIAIVSVLKNLHTILDIIDVAARSRYGRQVEWWAV